MKLLWINKGSITLANGGIILVEDYERPLDNGRLRAKAILTSDSFGNPVKFEWNGFEVKVVEEGITVR